MRRDTLEIMEDDLSVRVAQLEPYFFSGCSDPAIDWPPDLRSSHATLRDFLDAYTKLPSQLSSGPLSDDALCAYLYDTANGRVIADMSAAMSQIAFLLAAGCVTSRTRSPVFRKGILCLLAYLQSPWSALLPARRKTLRARVAELLRVFPLQEDDWVLLQERPATTLEEDSMNSHQVAVQWLKAIAQPKVVDEAMPVDQPQHLLSPSPELPDDLLLSPTPQATLAVDGQEPQQPQRADSLLDRVPLATQLLREDDLVEAHRVWPMVEKTKSVENDIEEPLISRRRPPRPKKRINKTDEEDAEPILQHVSAHVQNMLKTANETRSALVKDLSKLGVLVPKAEEHLSSVTSALKISKALSWWVFVLVLLICSKVC